MDQQHDGLTHVSFATQVRRRKLQCHHGAATGFARTVTEPCLSARKRAHACLLSCKRNLTGAPCYSQTCRDGNAQIFFCHALICRPKKGWATTRLFASELLCGGSNPHMQTRGCRRGLRGEAPTWSPLVSSTATSPSTWNSLRSVTLGSELINSTSSATTPALSEVGTTCAAQALLAAMPLLHLPSTNIHLRSINQQDPQQRTQKTGMEQRISECCKSRRKRWRPEYGLLQMGGRL